MWSKISIEQENTYYWKLGLKEIYLQKRNQEWLFSLKDLPELAKDIICGEPTSPLNDAEWLTFIGDSGNTLQPLPAFPDRPIVVKPKTALKVLPNKDVLLFIEIPLYIQFYSETGKNENLIFECCSQELSSTWFGELDDGTLAYSLPLEISTAFEKSKHASHTIICPVRLTNDSITTLDVQRFLLRGEYLTIYRHEKDLWSNEVKIKFKGESEFSDVQYVNQAPSFVKKPVQIATPRSSKSTNVFSKSFHFFKSLTE
jgi:hypothetical protein